MQVYSLISSILSDFYIFKPWSLDLFIRVPSKLYGEHTVLQPFRRIELMIHIVISVLPGTQRHCPRTICYDSPICLLKRYMYYIDDDIIDLYC